MKKAINLFSNLIFPPKCANCGDLIGVELTQKLSDPLCPTCRLHYESEKQRECSLCGLSMQFCRCMPKAMQRAQCLTLSKLVSYRPNDEGMRIKRFIYSVKHSNYQATFDFLADQMRALLIAEMREYKLLPEDCVITFLPRSYKNKATDGFDQSLALARALSKITGIELVRCFERRLFSGEQKRLNRYERQLNMNSAYKICDVEDIIKDKTVILVDDIVTTGASMAACARLAQAAGAYAVLGVCLGYTEKMKK